VCVSSKPLPHPHRAKFSPTPAVSPWQFKDIDSNNAWVELGDTLWNYRWLQAIQDVKPDIIEIGTS
jgi:hypothetical protein